MFNWGKSLLNGFWNDPLGSIVDGIMSIFETLIIDPIKHIWGEILKAIYMLWSTMASILDTIQVIYNMMVGTSEVVWQSTSSMGQSYSDATGALGANMSGVTHNLVVDVFLSDYVMGAFLKVIVLSLFLLLIFTMIAIVKIEYSKEHDYGKGAGNTSKRPIIERAIKSLLSFLLVPLACIFGVIASGVLMQAIDGATSPTSNTVISNKIFAICAHDANRVRTDGDFYAGLIHDSSGQFDAYDLSNDSSWNPNFATQTSQSELADYIDKLFTNGTSLQQAGVVQTGETYRFRGSGDKFANYINNGGGINDNSFFNSKNSSQVFYFYDLTHFQWLIGFFTIFYMGTILIRITLGAAGRLFELAILFVISPAILSMAPLDEGAAMKNWTKKFVGKVGMIYAPVVAINLYFILVGVLVQVDFSNSVNLAVAKGFGSDVNIMNTGLTSAFIQQIFNLFILIAGLQVCESAISWLSELIGAEDIDKAGKAIRGSMSNFVQTNAAAKYLATGAGRAKAGALNMATSGLGKLKEARTDHKNSALIKGKQVDAAAKFNKDDAEKAGKITGLKSERADLGKQLADERQKATEAKTNAENKLTTGSLAHSGVTMDSLDKYNKELETQKAIFANQEGLTDEQRAEKAMEAARNAAGIGTLSDDQLKDFNEAAANQKAATTFQQNADAMLTKVKEKDKEVKEAEKAREDARNEFNAQITGMADTVRGMSGRERRTARKEIRKSNRELVQNQKEYIAAKEAVVKAKGREGKFMAGTRDLVDYTSTSWGTYRSRRRGVKDNLASVVYQEGKDKYTGGGGGGDKKK